MPILAPPKNPRISRQREGPEPDRGEDELHQGLAVAAGLRRFPLRRSVSRREERRASWHRLQSLDEDDHSVRRSHQDLAVQHDQSRPIARFLSLGFGLLQQFNLGCLSQDRVLIHY